MSAAEEAQQTFASAIVAAQSRGASHEVSCIFRDWVRFNERHGKPIPLGVRLDGTPIYTR